MADYTPVFTPSKVIPLTASGAVAGGDILAVSGDGTVAKCTSLAATSYIGVAGNDAAANARVTVYCRGYVHESVADGTVTAGDQVTTTSTAGRQVKSLPAANISGVPPLAGDINTAVNNARAVIGVALKTAADNAKVRWMEF